MASFLVVERDFRSTLTEAYNLAYDSQGFYAQIMLYA